MPKPLKPRAHLNHIGIAAAQLPVLTRLFGILGFAPSGTEEVAEQGVRAHFLPLPILQTNLELLEPLDPAGTIAQFISKRGPGIHHLSFEVVKGQLDAVCAELTTAGYRLIYPTPKMGAHHMRVNFIHPSTAGGLLIEVMEKAT